MGIDPAVQQAGYAILAADDSDEFLSILKRYLGKCRAPYGPFHVSSANTLAAAEQFLGTHPVDCVLLDITLPDARNLEGLTAINEVVGGAAVVVLTGLDEETMAAKVMRAGAQDFYTKSPQLTGLDKVLVRAIQRQSAQNTYREQVAATEAELRAALEVLTSHMAQSGRANNLAAIRTRSPELFSELADTYLGLFRLRSEGLLGSPGQDGPEVEDLAIRIGRLLGGGVDVVDMHREAMKVLPGNHAALTIAARQSQLLAFEVLAKLADYYRDRYGGTHGDL